MSRSEQSQTQNVNVYIIGPQGVGKETFAKSFALHGFNDPVASTARKPVSLHGKAYSVRTICIEDASTLLVQQPDHWNLYMIMFDVTVRSSLDRAVDLWGQVQSGIFAYAGGPPLLCLVGNKDRFDVDRQVRRSDAWQVARDLRCEYFGMTDQRGFAAEDIYSHLITQYERFGDAQPPAYEENEAWMTRPPRNDSTPTSAIVAEEPLAAEVVRSPAPPTTLLVPPDYQTVTVEYDGPMTIQVAVMGDVANADKKLFAQLFAFRTTGPYPSTPSPLTSDFALDSRHRCTVVLQGVFDEPVRMRGPWEGSQKDPRVADAFVVLLDTRSRASLTAAQSDYAKILQARSLDRHAGVCVPLPTPVLLVALECSERRIEAEEVEMMAYSLNCAHFELDLRSAEAVEAIGDVGRALAARTWTGRQKAERLAQARGLRVSANPKANRGCWAALRRRLCSA